MPPEWAPTSSRDVCPVAQEGAGISQQGWVKTSQVGSPFLRTNEVLWYWRVWSSARPRPFCQSQPKPHSVVDDVTQGGDAHLREQALVCIEGDTSHLNGSECGSQAGIMFTLVTSSQDCTRPSLKVLRSTADAEC